MCAYLCKQSAHGAVIWYNTSERALHKCRQSTADGAEERLRRTQTRAHGRTRVYDFSRVTQLGRAHAAVDTTVHEHSLMCICVVNVWHMHGVFACMPFTVRTIAYKCNVWHTGWFGSHVGAHARIVRAHACTRAHVLSFVL